MADRPAPRLPETTHEPAPYDGPSRAEVLELRRRYLTPGLVTMYRDPVLIAQGAMQYVWDETGKRYLDALAGIVTVSVGHCHPAVAERVRPQADRLQHITTIYLHPAVGQLGEALADRLPGDLSVSYFTNCGSEANEVALLTAREHTGNVDVVALRNAYHGGTQAVMGLTAHGTWKFKSSPAANVKHATPGYCYRCPYGLEYPSCDLKCAHDVEALIRYETCGEVAAFIAEPIQGVGGVVDPPPEYFGIVYDIVRRHGGLCIADEVQTGFGRTGDHYWGFERYGVVPDLVTMAKGLGNGAPVGACVTTPEIAPVMKRRVHFNTFGGNPISMTQALATLDVIDADGIRENARRVGGHLKARLEALADEHALIGDVRGAGLMLGVEFVTDRETKAPATDATAEILERTKDAGLLLGKGGLYGNVIRIKPPMCLTIEDADFIADCLDWVLGSLGT